VSAIPGREALQPERTALAWQRTAVTAMVSMPPLVLVELRTGRPVLALGGALATALSVALVVSVRRRFSQLRDETRGYSPFHPMLGVALVTVLGGVGGALLGVTSWWG
jgi:uncharacterized membrane protein YidH (DUF202 family)